MSPLLLIKMEIMSADAKLSEKNGADAKLSEKNGADAKLSDKIGVEAEAATTATTNGDVSDRRDVAGRGRVRRLLRAKRANVAPRRSMRLAKRTGALLS